MMDTPPLAATNLTAKKLSKSFLVESIMSGAASGASKACSRSSAAYDPLMPTYYSNLSNYLYNLGFSAQRFPPAAACLPIPAHFTLPHGGVPATTGHHRPLEVAGAVYSFGGSPLGGGAVSRVAAHTTTTAGAAAANTALIRPADMEKSRPIRPTPTTRYTQRQTKIVSGKSSRSDDAEFFTKGRT